MMDYTKYEKARIIGARALQLSMGAPIMIKLTEEDLIKLRYNTLEIARIEFDKDLVPITVHRVLPQKNEEPELAKKALLKSIQKLDKSAKTGDALLDEVEDLEDDEPAQEEKDDFA